MPEEILRDQLQKLYKKLPKELKEAIFSAETADTIASTCEGNKLPEAKMPQVAKYTGRVLMGLLPPNEFKEALVKNVKLKEETAKNVAREITRFVFSPVKELLSQIYETERTPVAEAERASSGVFPKKSTSEIPVPEEEERPKRTDAYRESTG